MGGRTVARTLLLVGRAALARAAAGESSESLSVRLQEITVPRGLLRGTCPWPGVWGPWPGFHRLPSLPLPPHPSHQGRSPLPTGPGTLQGGPSRELTWAGALGLYFHALQGKLRLREAKGPRAKEKARPEPGICKTPIC